MPLHRHPIPCCSASRRVGGTLPRLLLESRHGLAVQAHRRRPVVRDPPPRRAAGLLRRRAAPVHAAGAARERAPQRRRSRTSTRSPGWDAKAEPSNEISFAPSRVLLQDLTGVPAVVDLAAMRNAMADLGGDPAKINPLIPAELVIDHSVQVDAFASRLGVRAERRARVRAQPRALPVPALGPDGVRRLQGRAAGHRHLPPGEPRVPRPRRRGPRRRGVPGHAGRHRLAHDDGQRARRARLGRRRDRGRGRDARPAALDARAAGRRLQAVAARCRRARPRPTSC